MVLMHQFLLGIKNGQKQINLSLLLIIEWKRMKGFDIYKKFDLMLEKKIGTKSLNLHILAIF